ncbi:MAG: hypothetical protein KAY32_06565 [Candidatus Eisenbacteria sp.]|nr:hypothetical protein [Candidatus Eisenbacteria bacterium]
MVAEANEVLEGVLFEMINGDDPDNPDDIDFSEAERLYREALQLDPAHEDANFGLAVTNLLVLSMDEEVNAAFDEWEAYLDSHIPFETDDTPATALGVPLGLRQGREAMLLPFDIVPLSVLAHASFANQEADPQISRIQDILEDRVIPRLAESRGYLQTVATHLNYVFTVTPEMQGDEEADPVEIDRTDILALRAACSLLSAACRVAVSYELGMAAYDSVNMLQSLQPGSGWMARRPNGLTMMQAARTEMLAAVDDLDASITSLLSEMDSGDPQDDDVIKIGPDDLSRADVDSLQQNLPNVRALLDGGYRRTENWDDDSSTPEVSLLIDLGAFFQDPVSDWKALLPDYTVQVAPHEYDSYSSYNSDYETRTVQIPASGHYYASLDVHYDDYELAWASSYGDQTIQDVLSEVVNGRVALIQEQEDWNGYYYGSAYYSGNLSAGEQSISIHWSEYFATADTWVYVPTITWDAEDFDSWVWPDPDLNGLLPEIASSQEFLSLFGVTENDWEHEWTLDWADWEFDDGSVTPVQPEEE